MTAPRILILERENKTTTRDDMVLMTIESYLLNQQYNDLGFIEKSARHREYSVNKRLGA